MLSYSVYISIIKVDITSSFAILEDKATLANICFNSFMQ